MLKTQRLVGVLRVLLVLAFAVLLVAQVLSLPAVLADWAEANPEVAGVVWLLAAAELGLLCVQVVIVCTWQLLTMVKDDRIFSDDSLVWVNTIVAAMAGGWLLLLTALVWVNVTDPPGPSGALLALMLIAAAVVGLLMTVMRALLRQATTLRSELEAVV